MWWQLKGVVISNTYALTLLQVIMEEREVVVTLLGIAQDGGRPQAGCKKDCCLPAYEDPSLVRRPVSLGIVGLDKSSHLFDVTRELAWQLDCWSNVGSFEGTLDSVWITHAHQGHVDGLGLFGRESIAAQNLALHCSNSFTELMQKTPAWKAMLDQGVLDLNSFESSQIISPTAECGFTVQPIMIPHRDELSDTHAFLIRGPKESLLYMPDHDSWSETLAMTDAEDIRSWFHSLEVGTVLLDGTFWSNDELENRDQQVVPHPPIVDTINALGTRQDGDPRIVFIHLNHTNPLHDPVSEQSVKVADFGWEIGSEGMLFLL